MNRHALNALEYFKVRDMVLSYLKSPCGWRAAGEWRLATDSHEVETLIEQTAQMRAFIDENGDIDLSNLVIGDDILKKARPENSFLSPHEISSVRTICFLGRLCRTRLLPMADRFPLLARMAQKLPILNNLEEKINTVLDDEAAFRETASVNLSRIRNSVSSVREGLFDLYRNLLARHGNDGVFQDDTLTTRAGRYVLLVKAAAKSRIRGIVHDRTDSGAGVYLEPQEAVAANNRLTELASEEEKEKLRLLRLLTAKIRDNAPEISMATFLLGTLDLIEARAMYSLRKDHVRPIFNDSGTLRIRNARHPVLESVLGDKVIPLDMDLGGEQKVLVITGPNTGGKTVALKTVGLLCLMAQSGLFIPADEGTSLSIFTDIFADIGDEQSIEQSLSTFSAHIKNISEAVRGADKGALVILDELGAGTDPVEGAPLAMAIIEHLLKRGAMTLASTHHGSLVAFASATPGAVNASMEFNGETLKPTYRLIMGVPGRSNAREVARHMDMPEEIIRRSMALQPEADQVVTSLLKDLNDQRRTMEKVMADLSSRESELRSLAKKNESELEKLRREKSAILSETRQEAIDLLTSAKKEVREALANAASKGGAVYHQLHRLKEEVLGMLPSEEPRLARPLKEFPGTGQRVRLGQAAADGTVISVNRKKKTVRMEIDGKIIEVPLDLLEEAGKGPARIENTAARGRYTLENDKPAASRLDIRGIRAADAAAMIERFLDQAWLSGLESAEILHGKGSGRLKDACVLHLLAHSGVKEFGPAPAERGGHGVTVIKFK